MFLGSINPQSLARDFKLARSIAEAHKGQDPHKYTNDLGLDTLEGTHVNGLAVVAKPVAKIDTLDHNRAPFVALQMRDCRKYILNVSMPPILALDLGD